ncbi:ribonuclease H-like domain-containing protein [Candidatus Woesearchaeota archaeon]|nr:ribonuclease H-like domain-containing protein [Candidatus Woesearchaeota archaeon]
MQDSLSYWAAAYARYKHAALCIDIETVRFNGPVSVVGTYRPADGLVEYVPFIRGQNLTPENLRDAFSGVRMLVTYNGLCFDVPKIRKDFPGVLPDDVVVFDLYRFALKLDINTNLKVLENTFGVDRTNLLTQKRGIANKLWRQYEERGNAEALRQLLDYNKDDTINLYPLAEKLVSIAKDKIS